MLGELSFERGDLSLAVESRCIYPQDVGSNERWMGQPEFRAAALQTYQREALFGKVGAATHGYDWIKSLGT